MRTPCPPLFYPLSPSYSRWPLWYFTHIHVSYCQPRTHLEPSLSQARAPGASVHVRPVQDQTPRQARAHLHGGLFFTSHLLGLQVPPWLHRADTGQAVGTNGATDNRGRAEQGPSNEARVPTISNSRLRYRGVLVCRGVHLFGGTISLFPRRVASGHFC